MPPKIGSSLCPLPFVQNPTDLLVLSLLSPSEIQACICGWNRRADVVRCLACGIIVLFLPAGKIMMFAAACGSLENAAVCDVSNVTTLAFMFAGYQEFNEDISRWSVGKVTAMQSAFDGATAFNGVLSAWDVSQVLDMGYTFAFASNFNQNLSTWDVSRVLDMGYTFADTYAFNQNLNQWVTGSVTTLCGTFRDAAQFNQPLNAWNISGVTTLEWTFKGASAFSQNLSAWVTSNVKSLYAAFYDTSVFNGVLSRWDVSRVLDLGYTFAYTSAFNQNLNQWATSSVTSLHGTFRRAVRFNQPLSAWNTSGVTNVEWTFGTATAFNQNLNQWVTSSVTSLHGTFAGDSSSKFNNPLNAWNVASVTTLRLTFDGAAAFNQSLASWNTRNVVSLYGLFKHAEVFDGTISAWDVSRVVDTQHTFEAATAFNSGVSTWNVSRVVVMSYMFAQAKSFDQDLSRWTLSGNLSAMETMFVATKLSTCNKAAIGKSWGDVQKADLFLEGYSHWPRRCPNNGIQCRAWQTRGASENPECEPALWLDVRSCMAKVWNGTHIIGQPENSFVVGAARSEWAAPFLDHVPDHVSIKNAKCTFLPSFSEMFARSMGPFLNRFGKNLRAAIPNIPVGDTFEHTAGDGISALVEFEAGSSDLFVIKLMASSNCSSALEFGDGNFFTSLGMATPMLSLKNITRAEGSPGCHSTQWTPGIALPGVEDLFLQSGRLQGEPKFSLSWFLPNATHSPKTPPTLLCPAKGSLTWPFELKAVLGPDQPDKDHIFEVRELHVVVLPRS